MLEKEKDIDAVTVTTPDHNHAIIAMAAIKKGKHTYCQKPLTHTVFEARQLALAAKQAKVTTQMGNQGHADEGARQINEWVAAGELGTVREVHCWTNRPVWPQGVGRPEGDMPVPDTVAWDLWLGAAAHRPYIERAYHPFNWRGWLDFGTGALGDMACHTAKIAVMALHLFDPDSGVAENSGIVENETYPKNSKITF